MDLVFMLPSSSSVGSSGWTQMIDFVSAIVNALNIDDGPARVGLLRFICLPTANAYQCPPNGGFSGGFRGGRAGSAPIPPLGDGPTPSRCSS